MATKECVLYDRVCINCKECSVCDLDHTKTCDNCCMCLDEADYNAITISGVEWAKPKSEA
ncbi:MAG: hypothetical protein ACOYJD_04505 [Christensenellales bacterium]